MVGTIISIGYGDNESKALSSVVWHIGGSVLGGMVLSGVLATAHWVLPELLGRELIVILVGILSVAYAAHELRLLRLPTPQRHWQVPRRWVFILTPQAYSFAFGFLLGMALLVRVHVATLYPVLVFGVLVGGWAAVLAGVAFGLGRGLPLLGFHVAGRRRGWSSLSDATALLDGLSWMVHPANGLLLAAGGMFLIFESGGM